MGVKGVVKVVEVGSGIIVNGVDVDLGVGVVLDVDVVDFVDVIVTGFGGGGGA